MHITTHITQSNSRTTLVEPHSNDNSLLPQQLKQALLQNAVEQHHDFTHLSAKLTRLVDSCGDCV